MESINPKLFLFLPSCFPHSNPSSTKHSCLVALVSSSMGSTQPQIRRSTRSHRATERFDDKTRFLPMERKRGDAGRLVESMVRSRDEGLPPTSQPGDVQDHRRTQRTVHIARGITRFTRVFRIPPSGRGVSSRVLPLFQNPNDLHGKRSQATCPVFRS